MDRNVFEKRAKALEDAYCQTRDRQLIEQLAASEALAKKKGELADATGIRNNDALLEGLLDLRITPEAIDALRLAPLVEIAWSEGRMAHRQRAAVLSAARQAKLADNYDAMRLLESWLDAAPPAGLLACWKQYIRWQCEHKSLEQIQALKDDTMDLALFVAESTGGILSFSRIGRVERAKLDELGAMLNEMAAAFACRQTESGSKESDSKSAI